MLSEGSSSCSYELMAMDGPAAPPLQKPTRNPFGSATCGAEAPRGINPAPQDLGFLLLVTASILTSSCKPTLLCHSEQSERPLFRLARLDRAWAAMPRDD